MDDQPQNPQPPMQPASQPQNPLAQPTAAKSLDDLIGNNAPGNGDLIAMPQPEEPEKPKFKIDKKWIIIAGAVLAGIAVIIGIIAIIKAVTKEPEVVSPAASSTKTEEKTEKVQTATDKETAVKDVLAEIKTAVSKIKITTPATEGSESTSFSLRFEDIYDTASPWYLADGMNTATTLEQSYGIYNGNSDDASLGAVESVMNTVIKTLEGLKFSEYTGVKLMAGVEYINEDTGVLCGGIEAALPMRISCGHVSWLSAEKIAFVNSLAEAYFEKTQAYPNILDAKQADVKNSVYEPYQKLTAALEDAVGLFYRATKVSNWVFFTGTQAVLPCEDYYKDTGARRAFAGEVCYDKTENAESTVKPN